MSILEVRESAQKPLDNDVLRQACPSAEDVPFFNHCMRLAREQGMTWEQGVQYAIEQRRGL